MNLQSLLQNLSSVVFYLRIVKYSVIYNTLNTMSIVCANSLSVGFVMWQRNSWGNFFSLYHIHAIASFDELRNLIHIISKGISNHQWFLEAIYQWIGSGYVNSINNPNGSVFRNFIQSVSLHFFAQYIGFLLVD